MARLPPFTLRARLLLLVALSHLPALRTHESNLYSALVAALDLVWLKHLVAEVRLAQGSTFTVINRNGTILAHHLDSKRWVGQSVTDAAIVKAVLTGRRGTAEAPGSMVSRAYWPSLLCPARLGLEQRSWGACEGEQ
jgi:hypothetical protein